MSIPRRILVGGRGADGNEAAKFIETTLHDPETGALFVLTNAERRFLRHAFCRDAQGRPLYPELLFSAPKKTGKTAFAAMVLIYVVRVLGGRFAEAYCIANDEEQAIGRVFTAAGRIILASPLLASDADITAQKIVFSSTGATITALANDFAGAAGANPTLTVFDELWGYMSERAHRLWDEMVPPPTRALAWRLTVSYAGYTGESDLLESQYKRGLTGERIGPDLTAQPGMLMFWTHTFTAPWQTEAWREQMRAQLRPNAYLRMIENRWVSSESTFVDLAWWDACVDATARPVVSDQRLPVWVGVDASVKRDSTALVACAWDANAKKVVLIAHRIFQPTSAEPLDFAETVEATLLEWKTRYAIRAVRYDPYQMMAVAQRLTMEGLPMVEFPQSSPNLTEASTNLYDLIKGRNLVAYADAALRLAVERSVAIETARGWRVTKEKSSHKIDVVVALGMAALGAVRGSAPSGLEIWQKLGAEETEAGSRPRFPQSAHEYGRNRIF